MISTSTRRRRVVFLILGCSGWCYLSPAVGVSCTALPGSRDVLGSDSEFAGPIGVNLSASELADPDLAGVLARLDQAGVRWVRFVLPWDEIESARGQAQWERFDRVFELLRAQPRLTPVVVLNGSPPGRGGPATRPIRSRRRRSGPTSVRCRGGGAPYGDQVRSTRCGISRTSRRTGRACRRSGRLPGPAPRGCRAHPFGRCRRANRAGCPCAEHRGGRR